MRMGWKKTALGALLGLTAMVGGCGGSYPIVAAQPARQTAIRDVRIVRGPGVPDDRWSYFVDHRLDQDLVAALRGSFPRAEGPELVVTVTHFTAPRAVGHAWLDARVDQVGPSGPVAEPFIVRAEAHGEADFWGSGELGRRDDAARRVCADVVRQVTSTLR